MKTMFVAAVAAFTLSACGVETASTAANAGAAKKQEFDQAKQTMDQFQKKLEQAQEQTAERATAADKQ